MATRTVPRRQPAPKPKPRRKARSHAGLGPATTVSWVRFLTPLWAAGVWMAGFFLAFVINLALLATFGLPFGLAAAGAGILTALVMQGVTWRRNAQHLPGPAHLRAVDRVSRTLDGVTDHTKVATRVVSALGRALKPTQLALWTPTRESTDFVLTAAVGPDPGLDALPAAWPAAFMAYVEGAEEATEMEILALAEFQRWVVERGLAICLPITAQGRLIGLMTAGPRVDGKPFTGGDRWLLDQTLRHTGLALSFLGLQTEDRIRRNSYDNLAHMYRDAQQRSITDGLTGLATHAYFKDQLGQRVSEAKRHEMPLSVMLLDIDHFKRVNDNFGHPVGDEVLMRVAALVKQAARHADTVARYGGEELALVLPQTDLEGALTLAERAREAVADMEIYDAKERKLPRITVSIGVASLEDASETAAAILSRADQALYVAKQQGRNQVVRAS